MTSAEPELLAWWTFDAGTDPVVEDASGNGHDLHAEGGPERTAAPSGGAVDLDGATQWLQTRGPVLRTDQSFSVAAWVRADAAALGGRMALPPGWFAMTAVAQPGPSLEDGLTHCPFYLGIRALDEYTPDVLKWCFEAAPVDGDPPGPPWPYVWEKALSTRVLDDSDLDTWVLLVGVFNVEAKTIHLYVPGSDDRGSATLADDWPFWQADGPVQIGRAYWKEHPVDQWHGSIGSVRLFRGVLTEQDAKELYATDTATA